MREQHAVPVIGITVPPPLSFRRRFVPMTDAVHEGGAFISFVRGSYYLPIRMYGWMDAAVRSGAPAPC